MILFESTSNSIGRNFKGNSGVRQIEDWLCWTVSHVFIIHTFPLFRLFDQPSVATCKQASR